MGETLIPDTKRSCASSKLKAKLPWMITRCFRNNLQKIPLISYYCSTYEIYKRKHFVNKIQNLSKLINKAKLVSMIRERKDWLKITEIDCSIKISLHKSYMSKAKSIVLLKNNSNRSLQTSCGPYFPVLFTRF